MLLIFCIIIMPSQASLLVLLFACAGVAATAMSMPWMDVSLTPAQRAAALLAEMNVRVVMKATGFWWSNSPFTQVTEKIWMLHGPPSGI